MHNIRVPADLCERPEIARLAEELNVKHAAAVGYVVGLWTWTARQAENGRLEGIPYKLLARGAGWIGPPVDFIKGLQRAGVLDGHQLRGWEEMNGQALREAKRKREWWRENRGKTAANNKDTSALGARALASSPAPNREA